ncbi:MAG TPA: hypothetical protein DD641_05900, partial [Deltaproteobacteria bacterium]|nr:hypothetical protein [Deltaproteobacteria bacterium]
MRQLPKYLTILLAVIIIILYSAAGVKRNSLWKDEYSIWSDTSRKSQQKARVHNTLGNAYNKRGLIDNAIEHYQIALMLKP